MNLSQIARLQALKKHLETFRKNHPKFPSFLNAVSHNALEEGTSHRLPIKIMLQT